MGGVVEPGSQAEQVGRLVLAVVIVLALPALPFGTYLIYPFVILTTWFHEMGHGISALLMGQQFERLLIFATGSGVAESFIEPGISPFRKAAIAAGGPLAPCMAGAALVMASAHQRLWRPVLWLVAAAIFASVIVYVRSPVGYFVLPSVAALFALVAWRGAAGFVRFTLQFTGVLAAMSMLRDFNYLFTRDAIINGRPILSDTGQIEAALGLPHWVWAGLILAVSAAMVGASLKYALADKRDGRRIARRAGSNSSANVVRFRRPPR